MSDLQPVRGTRDLLPAEYRFYAFIIDIAHRIAQTYGFEEMATPLMEKREVFQRTLGETSDAVSKEMYELVSRGEDHIVLRPENTASAARAVISNGLTQSLPLKYFYAGPMFRYERPQKGRYRQFYQFGVEFFGANDSLGDVEVISMAYQILKELGVEKRVQLEINSLGDAETRANYRKKLVSYLEGYRSELSSESQTRLDRNPLRILDSKDPGDQEVLQEAPRILDSLTNESHEVFARVRHGLDVLGIPYNDNPHLVRGLDYYNHVIFEFVTTELGAQSAVLAGGRYDGLVETLGGPSIPSVGWAAGTDRLMMMVDEAKLPLRPSLIAWMTEAQDGLSPEELQIVQMLRAEGFCVEIYPGKLGKSLTKASKRGADFALFAQNSDIVVKNMTTGEQEGAARGKLMAHLTQQGLRKVSMSS